MKTIKQILMDRDELTEAEADNLIEETREDLHNRISMEDSSAYDICEEVFGLEPDYLDELL